MYPDYHIHTRFSDDSSESVEAAIESAVSKGMPAVCITDHYDMDCPTGDFYLDTPAYFARLNVLKEKYDGRIDILIGVEIGAEPHLCGSGTVERYLQEYPFEYVILSDHFVDRIDPYYRDRLPISEEEMYGRYFAQLREVICGIDGYHTAAHLDYVARYGYDGGKACTYENYREPIDAILEHLIDKGLILEVNTAGYRKGLSYPNPQQAILRRYRELGGDRIILGSDAHAAADVGADFERAAELLRSLGFRYLTVPVRNTERQIPL